MTLRIRRATEETYEQLREILVHAMNSALLFGESAIRFKVIGSEIDVSLQSYDRRGELSAVEADPLRNERPESGSIPDRSTAPPSNATDPPVPLRRGTGEGAGQF